MRAGLDITILNGNPSENNRVFQDYINGLSDTLFMVGHFVEQIDLAKKEIKQCRGCWNCWVKTPGNCSLKDDMDIIYPKLLNCDLLIFASPIRMGFVSALLKRSMDRMIPLMMPYFRIINNEFHHSKRYKHYPTLGLLLEKDFTTDAEDLDIIKHIFQRTALNFHSELKFSHLITDSEKELINEINNL